MPYLKIMSNIKASLSRVRRMDNRGGVAVMFACALPVVIAAGGVAIDFATFNMKESTLQAAADEAATAGAKQMALASANDTVINGVVQAYLSSTLPVDDQNAKSTVTVDRKNLSVKVLLSEDWMPTFGYFFGEAMTPVISSATASLQGENKICILSLNKTENQAFRMMNSARIDAASCSINSNSTDPKGMFLQNNSSVIAAQICSSGGVSAAKSQTNVPPQTDCPQVPDPLADKSPPTFGVCTANNFAISSGTAILSPGVYCGGIDVSGNAKVTFDAGTYVIQDGNFSIRNSATAIGANVGFYLTGAGAALNFLGTASIDFSGAETGDMAGLLFFADRNSAGLTHIISATQAHKLTGTIYLPMDDLRIDPNSSVADTSAYTAIIANRIRIQRGPTLVLNTNYGATKVPVPDGVRTSATVVLTK
jgi:Putative Flp pilus-assembly TadE/G-like